MGPDRLTILSRLLEMQEPLPWLAEALRQYCWDYDGAAVELQPRHLIAALQRHLAGAMTAAEIEDWANLLEGREDINCQGGSEGWVAGILYELANPAITERLTTKRAQELIASCAETSP